MSKTHQAFQPPAQSYIADVFCMSPRSHCTDAHLLVWKGSRGQTPAFLLWLLQALKLRILGLPAWTPICVSVRLSAF